MSTGVSLLATSKATATVSAERARCGSARRGATAVAATCVGVPSTFTLAGPNAATEPAARDGQIGAMRSCGWRTGRTAPNISGPPPGPRGGQSPGQAVPEGVADEAVAGGPGPAVPLEHGG
jgi:hypothetical protein